MMGCCRAALQMGLSEIIGFLVQFYLLAASRGNPS
jgi:hypothetical protein